MKPPQEIIDFLANEHLQWEFKHPYITLLQPRRKSQSLLTDNDTYLHPYTKDHLTNNKRTTYLINPSILYR